MTHEELKFYCWCVIIGALSFICLIGILGLSKNENSQECYGGRSKEA